MSFPHYAMALFTSGSLSSLGALNVAPLVPLPPLLNIAAEWAAIVPLVCHLASHRRDYKTVGETALLGRVTLGLFPKLGTLTGLSRLLSNGPDFLDRASTRGGTSCVVWDVLWGTVFPCANGAVFDMLSDFIQRKADPKNSVNMPEAVRTAGPSDGDEKSPSESPSRHSSAVSASGANADDTKGTKTHFRRYQTLHTYRFRFDKPTSKFTNNLRRLLNTWYWTSLESAVLLGLAIVLIVCGAYGTATVLLCSAVSRAMAATVRVDRPRGYLESNEGQNDVCMLMAIHSNAQEWNLFTGQRDVVDTILNKTMFSIPDTRLTRIAAAWFRTAHALQLLAMTFVAGQKGWDGVFLVVVMLVDTISRLHLRDRQMARIWLEDSGVGVEYRRFRFTGRMIMLGAIHGFSGTKTSSWMDGIVCPYPRREAFLDHLREQTMDKTPWSEHDVQWIETNSKLARASSEILSATLRSEDV